MTKPERDWTKIKYYMSKLSVFLIKILKFFFSKEIEIAPGVFYLGGYLYENRKKPK